MRHLAILLLVACNGTDDLDPDTVTSIPPGTAIGTAATGAYEMESVTVECSGKCNTTFDGVIYSACDVGTRLDDTVLVTQTDGALQIDVEDSDYVSRLAGGLDSDGTYDVGGLRTQLGGAITITARVRGSIASSSLSGTARLWVSGRGLDCVITSEVTGTRS